MAFAGAVTAGVGGAAIGCFAAALLPFLLASRWATEPPATAAADLDMVFAVDFAGALVAFATLFALGDFGGAFNAALRADFDADFDADFGADLDAGFDAGLARDLDATFGTGLRAAADSDCKPGLRAVLKDLADLEVAADGRCWRARRGDFEELIA